MSTLNANAANLEMNLTRQSKVTNHQKHPEAFNTSLQHRPSVYSFIDETEPNAVDQNLVVEESIPTSDNVNVLDINSKNSQIEVYQEQLINSDNASVKNSKKRKHTDDSHSFSLSDGIESMYSFNSNTFNKNSSTKVADKSGGTSSNDINKDDSLLLIKTVFARCFKNKNVNVLEKISGNEVVIADSSDRESV